MARSTGKGRPWWDSWELPGKLDKMAAINKNIQIKEMSG